MNEQLTPLNENAIRVFGVLRHADEHELQLWEISVRARMPWRTVATALRGLRRAGLVRRRVEPDRTRWWSLNHERRTA